MRRLWVDRDRDRVGALDQADDGTLTFQYADAWLAAKGRFPLSVSLPLQRQPYGDAAHRFFANLLPEAEIRRLLCRRLGISVDNDFELLAAVGGECAGALTLLPEDTASAKATTDYRPLAKDELERLARTRILPAVDGRDGLRLSLAGAQDKLPVMIEGGDLFLPIGSSPSTHILKFPNRDFKQLPGNEVLTTLIAKHLGLPVVEVQLFDLRREGACLVTRYDRIRATRGAIVRLHQEDLCQALGLPPSMKYEKEGGPGFTRCFEVIRDHSTEPLLDGQSLLRWIAFNALVLNADAHAKNLALLYAGEALRLAPFYDLLCTRSYPRLSTELAMSIGGESNPTQVRQAHWERLASELGLGRTFVLTIVRELAEGFGEASQEAGREFRESYGERPALQMVLPKVRRQAKRILQLAG